MTKKTPAKADPKPTVINGSKIKPMFVKGVTTPCLFTSDNAPPNGSTITFKVGRKTYSGAVAHTFKADGETVVSFKGGITPVQK